tara:strand:- start:23800 stop:26532 length:2733 start_codon:yes stop_codon:yes gene_type:complete
MKQPNKNNKKEASDKEEVMSTMQKIQMSLDGAGMVPGIGEFADLTNAGLYAAQGDWKNAGISMAAMIPFIGSIGTGARTALNATKYGKKIMKVADRTMDAGKAIKKKISPNKTILKEPLQHFPEMSLPKGVSKIKSKMLPAVVKGQEATTKTFSMLDKITNSKVGKAVKGAYEYVPAGVTKRLSSMGFSPEQIATNMNRMKGAALIGGGANALLSGSSGNEDRSDMKEKSTYYNDEFGGKYKIINGQKVMVEEDGGMYSKAQQYMQGGMQDSPQQLPGGVMQPIGEGAVEFVGNEHDEAGMGSESGILLDPQTEVEDGETMTQVAAQGGMKDYFFSNKLKSGGMTFADKHKEMVSSGAGQEQVNYLAKMQEAVAGRNPGDIKAAYGGMRRYDEAGFKDVPQLNPLQQEYFKLLENQGERYQGPQEDPTMYDDHDGDGLPNFSDPEYRNLNDQGLALAKIQGNKNSTEQPKASVSKQDLKNYEAYGKTYDKVEGAMTDSGYKAGKRAEDQGKKGIAGRQNQLGDSGVYGEASMNTEAGRKDFFDRNKTMLGEMGVNSWEEWNPKEMAGEFQNTFNSKLTDRWDNDEQFRTEMENKGVSKEDYMSTGFSGEKGTASAQDGLFGEYSYSRTSEDFMNDPAAEDVDADVEDDFEVEKVTLDPTDTPTADKGDPNKPGKASESSESGKKGMDLTTAAQFLPSMMALGDKPDYMAQADPVAANAVVASDAAKINLDRVDYTDEKSRLQNQMNAMTYNPNRQMSTSEKAMMLSKFNEGTSKISSSETNANNEIGNREASANMQIDAANKSRRMQASTTNASNQLSADQINSKNKMAVDEFNRGADAATNDRKLNAIQTMATNLGTLRGDELRYEADKNVAKANLAGTVGPDGKTVYDRKAIDQMFSRASYGGVRKKK